MDEIGIWLPRKDMDRDADSDAVRKASLIDS